MISEFKIKNFLSFREEQTMSFEASPDQHYREYCCVEVKENVTLLKTAIIYGSNASGKTNLLIALEILKNLITGAPKDRNEKIPIQPFLLDSHSRNEKTHFFISFYIEQIKYVYSLSLTNERIYNEELSYYPSIQPARLFSRKYNQETDSTEVDFGQHLKLNKKERLIILGNSLNNCTVLASTGKSNIKHNQLNIVLNYFDSSVKNILKPSLNLSSYIMDQIEIVPEIKDFVLDLLRESDFNICDIEIKKEEVPLSENIVRLIESTPFLDDMKKEYKEKGTILRKDILYTHCTENGTHTLPEAAESRGTIRYAGMATILYHLIKENSILLIDEIETSIHYELLTYFIKLFLINGEKYSQLILTTHDINLLDEDFIRRDAIWFMNKTKGGGDTILERLSNKGLHKNLSPYNAYKQGKLGSKPKTGKIFLIDRENGGTQ